MQSEKVFLTCVVQILSGIITTHYGLVRWCFTRCFAFVGAMAYWTSFAVRLFTLVLVLIVSTTVACSTAVTVSAQTTAAACRWAYLSSRGFSDFAMQTMRQIFIFRRSIPTARAFLAALPKTARIAWLARGTSCITSVLANQTMCASSLTRCIGK